MKRAVPCYFKKEHASIFPLRTHARTDLDLYLLFTSVSSVFSLTHSRGKPSTVRLKLEAGRVVLLSVTSAISRRAKLLKPNPTRSDPTHLCRVTRISIHDFVGVVVRKPA